MRFRSSRGDARLQSWRTGTPRPYGATTPRPSTIKPQASSLRATRAPQPKTHGVEARPRTRAANRSSSKASSPSGGADRCVTPRGAPPLSRPALRSLRVRRPPAAGSVCGCVRVCVCTAAAPLADAARRGATTTNYSPSSSSSCVVVPVDSSQRRTSGSTAAARAFLTCAPHRTQNTEHRVVFPPAPVLYPRRRAHGRRREKGDRRGSVPR
ncbi:hypothetical protein BC628DRAFT_624093 [Trametes gibbosa]|nr:hypothetical protein BC628DRAFT_624093 [Trametes gibbosa]